MGRGITAADDIVKDDIVDMPNVWLTWVSWLSLHS